MTMIALANVQAALDTQRDTLVGIPSVKYDGTAPVAPAPSVAYVETDFVPATAQSITVGRPAEVERTGLYVVRFYSATGGASTLDDLADGLLALFPHGADFAVSGSNPVRIRGDLAPWRGLITATTAGRSVVTVTIPWRTRSAD